MGQGGVWVQGTGGGSGLQPFFTRKKKAVETEIERERAGPTIKEVDETAV